MTLGGPNLALQRTPATRAVLVDANAGDLWPGPLSFVVRRLMARGSKSAWSLDPGEVSSSGVGGNISGRGKAARSRALDLTEATITLRHEPSGVEVSGAVPPGHYSRARMRELKEQLHRRLFTELERLVAKHLRIPGR